MEFTTARKLIQKAHIAELLHQNTQETGPWEKCLFPALLWRPCLHSWVSRTELLFPRGCSCAVSTHPHWAASSALGMTVCAGNKGAQGSLHLPPLREAVYPHHSHSERDVFICHFPDDKIRLNFATAPILLTVVCVSPLIKTCTRNKSVCLLKIPLRSQEAERTQKPSYTLHEVSYSNFTNLESGFLRYRPSINETSSFLMKMQNFLIQSVPQGTARYFKNIGQILLCYSGRLHAFYESWFRFTAAEL